MQDHGRRPVPSLGIWKLYHSLPERSDAREGARLTHMESRSFSRCTPHSFRSRTHRPFAPIRRRRYRVIRASVHRHSGQVRPWREYGKFWAVKIAPNLRRWISRAQRCTPSNPSCETPPQARAWGQPAPTNVCRGNTVIKVHRPLAETLTHVLGHKLIGDRVRGRHDILGLCTSCLVQ